MNSPTKSTSGKHKNIKKSDKTHTQDTNTPSSFVSPIINTSNTLSPLSSPIILLNIGGHRVYYHLLDIIILWE